MSNTQKHFISFGLKIFLMSFGGIVVSNAILYYLTDYSLGKTVQEALVFMNTAKVATIKYTVTVNIIVSLAVFLMVFIETLYMSNRISGPMYRFEKTAGELAEGDLTVSPKLRAGDFLQPQADEFTEAIISMRGRMKAIKDCATRLDDDLAILDEQLRTTDISNAKQSLSRAAELTELINKELSYFKTT